MVRPDLAIQLSFVVRQARSIFSGFLGNSQTFKRINMQSATVFFALAFAVVAVSAIPSPIGGGYGHGFYGHGLDFYAYPKYTYNYGVADKLTGDQKSAGEVRDGPLTKGYYSVVQPDGVLRTVNYVVDPKLGFQAQVINKGIAGHPGIYGIHKGFAHHGHHGHHGGFGHFG